MSRESNIVYVGTNPPMDYVMWIMRGFSGPSVKEVTVKARGQAISTAVDAVEITRNRLMEGLEIGSITIGTEEMPPREGVGRARMVSTIQITLTRK